MKHCANSKLTTDQLDTKDYQASVLARFNSNIFVSYVLHTVLRNRLSTLNCVQ